MGKSRSGNFVGKPDGRSRGRPRRKLVDNIKMVVKAVRSENVKWIQLAL
jgi:hypothetical protein